jgi:hypothetical protein
MRRRVIPWLVLLVAALAYPLAVLAGGEPRFPSRAECAHPAKTGGDIEAVFGRFSTNAAAESLLRRVLQSGFESVRIESDGCGRLKVTLHGIPTLEVGRDFVAEAERVGFHPALEQATP